MKRTCYYHAGCPDGFGAAWAVWRAWGDEARYQPRGHGDPLAPARHRDETVVFVDIAPPIEPLLELCTTAERVVVLDHHVSARDRFLADPRVEAAVAEWDGQVIFDLDHSGAILSWHYFHPDAPPPDLLRYVEDQDLWSWKLPGSEAVNAAIGSYPRDFATWEALAARPVAELAREGEPIVRSQRMDVERALHGAHTVRIGDERIEAVNARFLRAPIGHELAGRAAHGRPWGLVYRLNGQVVDVSIYSIGDLDVSKVAEGFGGGGHRNASGFSVPLEHWLEDFLER